MANLSDAFGGIKVNKVGKEFLVFLNAVQGEKSEAYYTLVDPYDLSELKADDDGDITFDFSTSGRWSYSNNIEGYLQGKWLTERGEYDKKAYNKFIKALKTKKGSVIINYTDSDGGMNWMGTGQATLSADASFNNDFNEEVITVAGYAELCGYNEHEALDMLYGDEVVDAYNKYVEDLTKNNTVIAAPGEWHENIYEVE